MREEDIDQKIGAQEFEPLLDSHQAATLMRVHPETVKRRARNGEIPGMKFGKLWRFRGSALESFVREMIQENRDTDDENMAPSEPAVCALRNRRK